MIREIYLWLVVSIRFNRFASPLRDLHIDQWICWLGEAGGDLNDQPSSPFETLTRSLMACTDQKEVSSRASWKSSALLLPVPPVSSPAYLSSPLSSVTLWLATYHRLNADIVIYSTVQITYYSYSTYMNYIQYRRCISRGWNYAAHFDWYKICLKFTKFKVTSTKNKVTICKNQGYVLQKIRLQFTQFKVTIYTNQGYSLLVQKLWLQFTKLRLQFTKS